MILTTWFSQYIFIFLESFHLRLTSKFVKSANMVQNNLFFQKCNMVSKKAEFDADFESVEKVNKI
jgi:hypothetical protein